MVPAERKATAPILLPPYGPEREVEAVPYSAAQYWLQSTLFNFVCFFGFWRTTDALG